MALTNHERVGKALELLNAGLRPFVERELQAAHGKDWVAQSGLLDPPAPAGKKSKEPRLDAHALLGVMWDQWNDVFKKTLGQAERTLMSELRDVRNKWAHQEAFSTDDSYRALDSIQRLLTAVSAEEAAGEAPDSRGSRRRPARWRSQAVAGDCDAAPGRGLRALSTSRIRRRSRASSSRRRC